MPPGVVEAVPDVLANELFLASGEGPGLASVNPLVSVDHDLAFMNIAPSSVLLIRLLFH